MPGDLVYVGTAMAPGVIKTAGYGAVIFVTQLLWRQATEFLDRQLQRVYALEKVFDHFVEYVEEVGSYLNDQITRWTPSMSATFEQFRDRFSLEPLYNPRFTAVSFLHDRNGAFTSYSDVVVLRNGLALIEDYDITEALKATGFRSYKSGTPGVVEVYTKTLVDTEGGFRLVGSEDPVRFYDATYRQWVEAVLQVFNSETPSWCSEERNRNSVYSYRFVVTTPVDKENIGPRMDKNESGRNLIYEKIFTKKNVFHLWSLVCSLMTGKRFATYKGINDKNDIQSCRIELSGYEGDGSVGGSSESGCSTEFFSGSSGSSGSILPASSSSSGYSAVSNSTVFTLPAEGVPKLVCSVQGTNCDGDTRIQCSWQLPSALPPPPIANQVPGPWIHGGPCITVPTDDSKPSSLDCFDACTNLSGDARLECYTKCCDRSPLLCFDKCIGLSESDRLKCFEDCCKSHI